jgi:hypothetical protein
MSRQSAGFKSNDLTSMNSHSMEYLTKNPEKGSLTVEVIDTGVGIGISQLSYLLII